MAAQSTDYLRDLDKARASTVAFLQATGETDRARVARGILWITLSVLVHFNGRERARRILHEEMIDFGLQASPSGPQPIDRQIVAAWGIGLAGGLLWGALLARAIP